MNTLSTNTTGSYNTAAGQGALYYNTTGTKNSASGSSALRLNTTGSYNTGIGNRALDANTEGDKNTVLGYYAGGLNTTGDANVFIGHNAGYNSSYATSDNKLVIANSNTTSPLVDGDFDAATLTVNGALTANSMAAGDVSAAEFAYLDGVTSAIQTQLNAKGTVSSLSDLSVTATATELNLMDLSLIHI